MSDIDLDLLEMITDYDLPLELTTMPANARAIFMATFKHARKKDLERLAAESALKQVQKYFSMEGDEWVKRKEYDEPEIDPETGEQIDPETGEPIEEDEDGEDTSIDEDEDEDGDEGDHDEEYTKTTKTRETTESSRRRRIAEQAAEKAVERADSMVEVTETLALDAAGFRLTGDGYLVANPRVARTGIQIYKGFEVGRPDMEEVKVYRPETEVFSHAAMASLAHRPITLDHPDTKVDATNWRKLSIGNTSGEVARDGDFIRVPLVLMDAAAILAAQSGTSQLSVGYGAKLVWGDGVTPQGERFNAMQSEIRANHIALVRVARGGDSLRIGDKEKRARALSLKREGDGDRQQRRKAMSDRTLTIDGVSIALEDKDGQILERHLSVLDKTIKDQGESVGALNARIRELETALTQCQKGTDSKDGEIAVLKQSVADSQITPEKLDKALEKRMDVVDRAMTFFGDQKYVWGGKADAQIRRDVVTARMGEQKVKTMNDDAIEGAFLSITEPETQDGFKQMTQSFSRPPVMNHNDKAAAAYHKRNENLQNSWRRNKGGSKNVVA